MKRKTKILITLGCAMAGALALGACAKADTTYRDFAKQGANVIITYDKNGGNFASDHSIDIRDVYYYDDIGDGLKLLAPGDSKRGDASTSTIMRPDYQLAGWYTERHERKDESGNDLDDYGELCSVSGRPKGYTYSGLWDFSTRKLTKGDLTETTESWGTAYRLTLYAAWVPNYTYEYYVKEGDAWVCYGSSTRTSGRDTAVPAWSERTGALDYNGIPVYSPDGAGYSMAGLYLDEALQQPVADNNMEHVTELATQTKNAAGDDAKGIPHGGSINMENGTGVNLIRKCYTTWRERVWFHITTAMQFISNGTNYDAGYEIKADLNFLTERTDANGNKVVQPIAQWNGTNGVFKGIIEGGKHTITGLTATQTADAQKAGGLYAEIASGAIIRDITFKDMNFTITGTRQQNGFYGLLAGTVDEGATLENVTVSGTLHLKNPVPNYNFANYKIGLLSGNLLTKGIATDNISVVVDSVQDGFNMDTETWNIVWPVKAQVEADGSVTLTVNENASVDPNPGAAAPPNGDGDA